MENCTQNTFLFVYVLLQISKWFFHHNNYHRIPKTGNRTIIWLNKYKMYMYMSNWDVSLFWLFVPISIHFFFCWLNVPFFSSTCQRQCELLPSLGIYRPLTFHILIFSSETPRPNELFNMAATGNSCFWMFDF